MGHELTDPTSSPLFTGLRSDETARIIAAASRRTFKGSKIIISADEPATRLFLVTGGHVDYFVLTSHGGEILLRRAVPGEVFGVASFFPHPTGYLGTAKTAGHSEVLEWERRTVLWLANAYPRFRENAFLSTLQYIPIFVKRHTRLMSSTVAERLASAVADLACRTGRVLPAGVEVELKNQDLASLADTTIFTATRILKRWEREGTVSKSRGKVLIRRPEKLLS
jgi:CRP-like cAMP-binding protein